MENNNWKEELEEVNKKDQEVLKSVKNKVDNKIYQDILFSIEESEFTFDYIITDKPKGKYQKEDGFESLQGQWVDQTTNGGFIGDEFAGTISIKIGENEFFQFYYSM